MTSSMMRVPERIIFGKDGALYGFTEPPIDGISYDEYEYENNRIQLQELPSKLTAYKYIETDSVKGAMENHHLLTSIAVEKELTLVIYYRCSLLLVRKLFTDKFLDKIIVEAPGAINSRILLMLELS
uniref:Methylase_S domain-containing protein n=1 Tax=Strongyloides papillosus TaxID=174720 RepID=A0A0N5CCR7_STREA